MSKEYKKLLGNRVYIEVDMPNYTIVMDEAIKKKLIAEVVKELNRAKIYDIGTGVTKDTIEIGDEVLVGRDGVVKGEFINLSEKKTVLMVSPFDIIHIW